MKAKPELRDECVRLRVEERRSYREIIALTGVSKGSLSGWLKDLPLTMDEVNQRKAAATPAPAPSRKKERGMESALHRTVRLHNTTPSQIGRVCEAAVLLRLLMHGMTTYGSSFDGDRADWVVDTGHRLVKVQVKMAIQGSSGLPLVKLMRNHGRTRYVLGDFDFLVGFDLFTDTAYIWHFNELATRNKAVTIDPTAAERWDKFLVP